MIIEYNSLGNKIELDIPDDAMHLGLAMSGGMDSALLCHMLLDNMRKWQKLTIFTVDLKDSKLFVDTILKSFDTNIEIEIKTIPDPKNPNGALTPQFKELAKTVDYFYTATTALPPWADGIPAGQKPRRYLETRWQNVITPFGIYDKTIVVDLYKRLGLLGSLLPLTHTCTERASTNCGQCFACRERQWAFIIQGIEDCLEYE